MMIVNLLYSKFTVLLLLVVMLGFTSCKNKKKVGELSDPQAAKEQIEREISELEETSDEETPERKAVKEPSKTNTIQDYFSAIASSASPQVADRNINEALTMFSGPGVPVLIIIYGSGNSADYDEPTTIRKYLEYLKDTRNNRAKVEEMVLDDYGQIKELVLRKE